MRAWTGRARALTPWPPLPPGEGGPEDPLTFTTCRSHQRAATYAAILLGGLVPTITVSAQEPPPWHLEGALEHAFGNSPALRVQNAELDEIASRRLRARQLPHNPELALEAADRSGPDGTTTPARVDDSRTLVLVSAFSNAPLRVERGCGEALGMTEAG